MTPKLQLAFDECTRHVHYLQSARNRLPHPVTAAHFEASSEGFIAVLDQFVFRFTKLQDALGQCADLADAVGLRAGAAFAGWAYRPNYQPVAMQEPRRCVA